MQNDLSIMIVWLVVLVVCVLSPIMAPLTAITLIAVPPTTASPTTDTGRTFHPPTTRLSSVLAAMVTVLDSQVNLNNTNTTTLAPDGQGLDDLTARGNYVGMVK